MSLKRWAGIGLKVLGFCFCLLLLVCVLTNEVRDGEGYLRSQGRLRTIGTALGHYHDVYSRLPSAVVRDKAGRPLYSWRVVLLPFLDEDSLYREFKLDEPWDDPHNKKLLEMMPKCFKPYGGGNESP